MYGILADRRVLFLITRTAVQAYPATLRDHELARSVLGSPTIRPKSGRRVMGLLLRDATDACTRRLDAYHGPDYVRQGLAVISMGCRVDAQAYVLGPVVTLREGIIQGDPLSGEAKA